MRYLFLFLAIFFNSYALTVTCNTNKFVTSNVTPSTPTLNGKPYCSAMGGGLVWTNNPTTSPCIMVSFSVVTSTLSYSAGTTQPTCPTQPTTPTGVGSTACFINYDVTPRTFVCNPKPADNVSVSQRCDNTYVSTTDNSIKQCNPNTNIATVIENATSAKMVNGELEITCKTGYSIDYLPTLSVGVNDIPYDTVSCIPTPVKDPEPVIVIDPTTGDTVTTNPDGSTVVKKIDGTIISTDTKGVSTTTYTNGSTSISGSYGAATGGTTSSVIIGANTPLESGTIGATDYTPSLVSTTCSSTTLTLQERTLCEINQGIKNQNSESNPQNSLNNILKDINSDNNAAYAAINKNLKYTNDNLDLLNKNAIASNINTNSLNQTGMGIKTGVDDLNTKLQSIDENLKNEAQNNDKLNDGVNNAMFNETNSTGLIDGLGIGLDTMITAASDFYSNITDSYSNVKENYEYLYDFLMGKQNISHNLGLHSISLPKYNYTIFGQNLSFDAFFNVDLYSLFSAIRPFVTFIFNIFFITMNIRFIFINFFNSRIGS